VGRNDRFFEIGGHSMLALKMFARLGERFTPTPNVRDLFRYPSLRELAAHIGQAKHRHRTEWTPLVALTSDERLPALYCVPGAGLMALSYQPLAHALKERLAVKVFESQGFDANSSPARSIAEIVDVNLEALLAVDPEGPYLLAGHSFGGAVAFQMAQALEARGKRAELLLLDSWLYLRDAERKVRPSAVAQMHQWLFDTDDIRADEHDDASTRESFERLLRQQGLLPAQGGAEAVGRFLDVFETQLAIFGDYLPAGRFSGRVSLLLAQEGRIARLTQAELMEHYRCACAGAPEVVAVAGGHLSMLRRENVESLANALLEQTQATIVKIA
jgi:thioesterase domain-containing protein